MSQGAVLGQMAVDGQQRLYQGEPENVRQVTLEQWKQQRLKFLLTQDTASNLLHRMFGVDEAGDAADANRVADGFNSLIGQMYDAQTSAFNGAGGIEAFTNVVTAANLDPVELDMVCQLFFDPETASAMFHQLQEEEIEARIANTNSDETIIPTSEARTVFSRFKDALHQLLDPDGNGQPKTGEGGNPSETIGGVTMQIVAEFGEGYFTENFSRTSVELNGQRVELAGDSVQGGREKNADHAASHKVTLPDGTEGMVFALADGIGSTQNSVRASERAIHLLARKIAGRLANGETGGDMMTGAMTDTNGDFKKEDLQAQTTLNGVLVTQVVEGGYGVKAVNVGDSDTLSLRFDRNGTKVNRLSKRDNPDNSEQAHLLTQAIGGGEVNPHAAEQTIGPGDMVVVMSDGVRNAIEAAYKDQTFEQVLQSRTTAEQVQKLLEQAADWANSTVGSDNTTYLTVTMP